MFESKELTRVPPFTTKDWLISDAPNWYYMPFQLEHDLTYSETPRWVPLTGGRADAGWYYGNTSVVQSKFRKFTLEDYLKISARNAQDLTRVLAERTKLEQALAQTHQPRQPI